MNIIRVIERIAHVQGAIAMLHGLMVACDGKLDLSSCEMTDCIEGCVEYLAYALTELMEEADEK